MSSNDDVLANSQRRPPAQYSGALHFGTHRITPPEAPVDVTAHLEWLDDLMFAAIDGEPAALQEAADAWKKALAELGTQVVEESRRQYLRRAQSVWNALRRQPNHPPHKVFAAIEIISLLAGKTW
jgi:hypothetical protein